MLIGGKIATSVFEGQRGKLSSRQHSHDEIKLFIATIRHFLTLLLVTTTICSLLKQHSIRTIIVKSKVSLLRAVPIPYI
jgi:hypothetical protein